MARYLNELDDDGIVDGSLARVVEVVGLLDFTIRLMLQGMLL